ncbi:MAG: hypothetical protein IPN42_12465 [Methylococcaceae bacterium]|nr:hypothetical protein [Methylococcaceae bacterium]
MRRYGRFLAILAFCATGFWFIVPIATNYVQQWFQFVENADPHTLSTKAVNSLVYPITADKWLTFAVPEESQQLRIITNAHIKRADSLSLNPNWAYAVRYEMLDKDDHVLSSGLYHQYSRISSYKDEKGELIYNNYYANKALVPLDGRLILFGLQGMKKIALLRLKLEVTNPAVIEAAVRVYVPVKIAEQYLATEWLRMKQTQRENLAKNSIYPASLLSPSEKKNLVKHQWQPLGPTGIIEKDYRTLILYTLNDIEADATLTLASGLQADNRHSAVIPLPEDGGDVELSFKALDGSALTTPLEINVQWFGRTSKERWQKTEIRPKDATSTKFKLTGGLLVIRPALPVIVNASLTTATEAKHDISDALLSIKAYRANIGVEFGVLHYRQQSSALRVDVRRIVDSSQSTDNEKLGYQWLNAEGQIIASGELAAPMQASLYDRIASIADGIDVTDAMSYYLQVPPEVVQIRFTANRPELLVSVYNQPYGFTKTQVIPEDLYVAHNTFKEVRDQQLSWFPLPASNEKELITQQGVQWISGQYKPPEDKPEALAGDYLWQDFIPQPPAPAEYVLTDYSGDEPRAEALPSIFCDLAQNRNNTVKLSAINGLQTIAPELIYLRNDIKPFKFEFIVDSEKINTMEAMGKQGVIRTPELEVGSRTMRLNTDSGGRWLMNYRSQCQGKRYLKKRVFALNSNRPLEFIVEHGSEDEVFTARFYTVSGNAERSQIKVSITPLAEIEGRGFITESWTYTHRLYDIRPLPNSKLPVLYKQYRNMNDRELIAIPLNSDLPAGSYRIQAALVQGSPGYAILSQIKPGKHEQRRFYREVNLEKR